MDILSLVLREDNSTLVLAKISKNEIKIIKYHAFMPILETIIDGHEEVVADEIAAALAAAKMPVTLPILITLPGTRVEIDSWPSLYIDREQLDKGMAEWVENHFEKNYEGEWSTAVIQGTDRRGGLYISGAGVPVVWINTIMNACQSIKLEVLRIEPEPLALFRLYPGAEGIIIDSQDEKTTITGFFPGKGIINVIFKTINHRELEQNIILFEHTAQETFGKMEMQRVPIICHGVNVEAQHISEHFQGRIRDLEYPEEVKLDKKTMEPPPASFGAIGALFGIDDEADSTGNKVNFIPTQILKVQRSKRIAKKGIIALKYVAALLLFGLFVEAGILGYWYFDHDKAIPNDIQQQYKAAVDENLQQLKYSDILQKAANEDLGVVKLSDTLAYLMPEGIKLTKIIIAEQGNIIIEGYGQDPGKFNVYVSSINTETQLFTSAQLDRISSAGNGNKSFVIQAKTVR